MHESASRSIGLALGDETNAANPMCPARRKIRSTSDPTWTHRRTEQTIISRAGFIAVIREQIFLSADDSIKYIHFFFIIESNGTAKCEKHVQITPVNASAENKGPKKRWSKNMKKRDCKAKDQTSAYSLLL